MRTNLIFAAILASLTPIVDIPSNEERPLNVLLIITDDLGTDMLSSYGIGVDIPTTPNMDALARRSVLFRNAWGTPLCSPTRACIQTGRFGFRTGIGMTVKDSVAYNGLDLSEVILPEMIDAGTNHGYRHALFGKWHLNHASEPDLSGAPRGLAVVNLQGYDHFEGAIHNFVSPESYVNWPKVTNGVGRRSTEYATTATVDDFLSWQEKSEEPYFAVLSFNAPHAPFHLPPKGMYSSKVNTSVLAKDNPRPYYKAMVEALDFELGRLFSSLGSSIDNTMVIFMGDNGVPSVVVRKDPHEVLEDDHCKGSAYEGGVNIPLMISGPRVTAPGTECGALVHAVDVFSTVAELVGANLDDPDVYPDDRVLDSISMVPFLTQPGRASLRRINYTEKFFENTLAGAQVDHTQLAKVPMCQPVVDSSTTTPDLRLTMCGQALVDYTDNQMAIRLIGAPVKSKAFLLVGGYKPGANPRYGGLLTTSSKTMDRLDTASGKLKLRKPMLTDENGELEIIGVMHQRRNPVDLYFQFVVQDGESSEWRASNAVRANQTINVKGVVNEDGYKLISYVSGGPSELYYLPSDEKEQADLLVNGIDSLSDLERAAYLELRAEIDSQLGSVR